MSSIRNCLRGLLIALLVSAALFAQTPASQPPLWSAKPDVAAFEKLENERLAAAQRSVDQLLAVKGPRTVENTLAPFDEATRQFDSAAYFSGLMEQVHPDAAFRDRATAMTRKVSDAIRAMSLNRGVYDALASLDLSKADPATRHYVQRQLLQFRLAGVDKDDATRARLRKLNDELTTEQSAFDRNISDDQRSVAADPAELDGLPQDFIARHKPGSDGKVALTTNYPDFVPVMKFARGDALRRRLLEAFLNRAYPKNRDVLKSMMQTRYQIASIVGYPSWADYNAADKMIGKGEKIAEFIGQLDQAARPIAQREYAMLLAEKQKTQPNARRIEDYERMYLEELVRRSQYDFDSQSVRPYLPYAEVKQGILDTAAKLFQVSFKQEPGVPAWAPDVETWDVIDQGKMIGRFYLDMHPRQGKYSHAAMFSLLDGIRDKQLPEAALVCNFPQPTAADPGLMEYDDVVTFFHEFGHLMHWILGGQQQWAGISGLSMEMDFVEAPSQMLEEWMHSPQVLASFARHYKMAEPVPAGLVARMNRAEAFGRGTWVMRQNSYTALSYDLYKSDPQKIDVDAVSRSDAERYTLFTPLPNTYYYASFGHLGAYSSAYYTYLWDKVIAEDFFQQFDRGNLLAGDAPLRYRRIVLQPGGSMPASELVRNFLGRAQNTAAFQEWLGAEFAAPPPPSKSTGR